MPLLKAKRQLNSMKSGECVKVIATDAASVRDFSSFVALTGHTLKQDPLEQDSFIYYIIKV
jgi:tRNA 2-thiouridine synthesizing protein A